MDTPNHYWPPYVGTEFNPTPNDEQRRQMFMTDSEYKQTLKDNPELLWHPEVITSPDCPSRDFKYIEPEITTAITAIETNQVSSRVSLASRFS